ncbi:MAG: phosphotransferase [Desulfobacterales bacterium]|nr:phosphotransferase [Desulfobacterales bacterium]
MDFKAVTSLGRFKDIVMILIKYGFDDLIERLDLPGGDLLKRVNKVEQNLGTYERIRLAFQDLGPTFVKFGQIMSLRPDLLPPPLIEELSKLQDDVAPVDIERIKEVVEQSTGKPLEETFSIFDTAPLAAASISQVHRGVLKSGGQIVSVKVQRPDIQSKMETDLNILAFVAERLHERVEELKNFDLPNLVQLIRRTLLRELDFNRESRNMKIARSYAGEGSKIYIPEVYEQYCTKQLLIMEYVQGAKLTEIDFGALTDPESLAKQGLNAAINQILKDGFFHADPHPGNILVTSDERICLIDWGMTGRLSERDRRELIYLLKSVFEKDGEAMVLALLRITTGDNTIDQRGLERDLLDIMDSHYAVPLKDMNIGQLLMAITDTLRTYRLRLPPDLVIMIKALVTAEGTARTIYPALDVVSEARGQISELAKERYKPETIWRSIRFAFSQFFNLQKEIPKRFESILDKADQGELTFGFRHQNLDAFMKTIDNVTSRLSFAIIIGSMVIGSSMIVTTGVKPLLFGFPALGVIGYILSGLLGFWLIFNIIRKRKY